MDKQVSNQIVLFAGQNADGASGAQNVESFLHVMLELAMIGYTGTIKFVGSNADAKPDFSAAASATNPWTYVKCVNLIDGSAVNGGTGLSGTATTSITNLEVNANGFKWIGAILSSTAAGSVNLKAKGFSNH